MARPSRSWWDRVRQIVQLLALVTDETVELRYNLTRLHSALGYRTPQEVMDEYLNGQEAA